MKKIILGNTRQLVSEYCLGTMYFGTKVDNLQSEKILNHYCEAGGNFIDTSNNYSFWWEGGTGDESETLIGNWLKNQKRDNLILATKCGGRPTEYQGDLDSIQLEGLSYDAIIRSVEDSLVRLKTDYVDILYAHIDLEDYPVEERLIAFTKLKEQGKIRFTGISNTEAWRVEQSQNISKANNYVPYSCIQQRFTYLRPKRTADFWLQKLLTEEMINYARSEKDITLLAYSVLLSGAYNESDQELPENHRTTDNMLRMALLKSLAEAKNCTMNQLVLAWVMNQKAKIIPIIAGSKVSQIKESIAASNVVLNEHEIKLLNNAGE